MELTTEQLKKVIDGVELSDGEKLQTQSYSGRAMFGSRCLGYTVDGHNMLTSVAAIMANAESMNIDLEKMVAVFDESRTDNMGRSAMIVYFPRMDVEGIDFSSDEEGDDE